MALNPLISLQAYTPDLGQTIGNALTNAGNFNAVRENRQTAGLRNQIAVSEADQARLKSMAITAGQILPGLESNDTEGVRTILTNRRNQLKKLGLETQDLDQGLVLLDSNPELLKTYANRAIQMVGMFGQGETDPSSVREYNFYQGLDAEGQKRFMDLKRQGFNVGGVQYSSSGDQVIPTDKIASDKGAIAAASERGKIQGKESTATGQAELTSAQVEAEQNKAKLADRERALQAEFTRAQDIKSLLDRASKSASLKNYYGAVSGRTPPVKQDTLDLQADIERVISLASLAARGELKGQGTITDFEGRMLTNAQTVLANRLISPERAQEEMERISDLMQDIMNRGAKASGSIAEPKTDAEYNALPSGTIYIDPDDGKQYRKP